MLSKTAEQVITDYLNLPFRGVSGVRTPYFNNTRLKQRGQLRVLVGKGTPEEIAEEAQIISIQYHAGLFEKDGACCLHNKHTGEPVTEGEMRKFLIDNSLGIECSGFVTHVLRAHYLETKGIDITKKLFIVSPKHILRYLISRLRPIENISVLTYASDKNTSLIMNSSGTEYSKLTPGDIVIMLETGPTGKRNHILLITGIEGKTIHYAHARAWSSEGKYGHGVNQGTITIIDPAKPLLDQTWTENGVTGRENETYLEAAGAKVLEIRRLTF